MATHNDLGKKGEDLAVEYLQKNGYKILARNFRFQKAEIDIIAEAVTKTKIKLIVSAANRYLEEFNKNQEVRFDIIAVLPDEKGNLNIEHIENSFEAFDAN